MDQPIVHPGPFDYRVLVGQKEHRSQDVWDNGTHESPRCRRLDGEFWQHIKEHPIHERVLQYLCRAGFYGIYAAGHTSLDHAMITSLLERWRPETHTFHLRTGEATITLQDVSVLYGLPVDGLPVTGIDDQLQTVDWQRIMQRLLGWAPLDTHFDGNSLKMGSLISYVTSLYPITSWTAESAVQQRVRLYLLWMIGGILAADTSCRVKLMFLKLLDDLDRVGDYAWGAASLAILYRYLCRGSQQGSSVIAGFLPLLQVWIYERILPFRPRRELQLDGPSLVIAGFPGPPRASIWSVALHHDTEAAHLLYLFRDQLDLLTDDQFIWQPYSDNILAALPDYCTRGQDIWLAIVPLIAWDALEWHQPDRVLRQFGLAQHIPHDIEWKFKHFEVDRRGRAGTNWEHKYATEVQVWSERRDRLAFGEVQFGDELDNEYVNWYNSITRHLVSNPSRQFEQGYKTLAGSHEVLARCLHRIYKDSLGFMTNEIPAVREIGASFSGLALNAFISAGQHGRDQINSQYPGGNDYVDPPPPPRRRRGRGGAQADRRHEHAEQREIDSPGIQSHPSVNPATCLTLDHFPSASRTHDVPDGTSAGSDPWEACFSDMGDPGMRYSPHTPYQSPLRMDSDFIQKARGNVQEQHHPTDAVPFSLDDDCDLTPHLVPTGQGRGRPRGRPPGKGKSRVVEGVGVRVTRPDDAEGRGLAHQHGLRCRANIQPRGCGTH